MLGVMCTCLTTCLVTLVCLLCQVCLNHVGLGVSDQMFGVPAVLVVSGVHGVPESCWARCARCAWCYVYILINLSCHSRVSDVCAMTCVFRKIPQP